jgi:hypothetical protein
LRPAEWGSAVILRGKSAEPNVRFGSKADIEAPSSDVRFTPKSGHWLSASGCPLCAKSGHSKVLDYYSETGWAVREFHADDL